MGHRRYRKKEDGLRETTDADGWSGVERAEHEVACGMLRIVVDKYP